MYLQLLHGGGVLSLQLGHALLLLPQLQHLRAREGAR
jgi:hypothetical protein